MTDRPAGDGTGDGTGGGSRGDPGGAAGGDGGAGGIVRVDHITPLWLSHHWPEDYDRCVRFGRSHVCRRCVVLWPLAFAVMLLSVPWSAPLPVDVAALVVLPLPAVVEFVVEHLGWARYSPLRQVAVTVPLAVGLGRGFARYLDDQTDLLFWGAVAVYAAVCLAAAWWGWTHPSTAHDRR